MCQIGPALPKEALSLSRLMFTSAAYRLKQVYPAVFVPLLPRFGVSVSDITSNPTKHIFEPIPFTTGFVESDEEVEVLKLKSEVPARPTARVEPSRISSKNVTMEFVDNLDEGLSDYRAFSPPVPSTQAPLPELPRGEGKRPVRSTEFNNRTAPNVSQDAKYLSERAADSAQPLVSGVQRAGSTVANGASRLTSRVADGAQAARDQLPSWRRVAYASVLGISVGTLSYFHAPVIVPSASYAANQLGFAGLTGGLTTAAVWAKPNLPKGLVWATAAAVMGAALTVTAVPGVSAGYLAAAVLGSAIIGYNMASHEQALKNVLFYGVLAGALYASCNVLEPVLGITRAGAAA
jgi:hypothetical protein